MAERHEYEHAPAPAHELSPVEDASYESGLSSSDSDSVDTQPRRRQGSTASTLQTRSSSRTGPAEISRIYSGVHLDDHSVYQGEDDHDSSGEESNEKDANPEVEVDNGIVTEKDRDLEANRQGPTAELEKSRTRRSAQSSDAKLVGCCIFVRAGPAC